MSVLDFASVANSFTSRMLMSLYLSRLHTYHLTSIKQVTPVLNRTPCQPLPGLILPSAFKRVRLFANEVGLVLQLLEHSVYSCYVDGYVLRLYYGVRYSYYVSRLQFFNPAKVGYLEVSYRVHLTNLTIPAHRHTP